MNLVNGGFKPYFFSRAVFKLSLYEVGQQRDDRVRILLTLALENGTAKECKGRYYLTPALENGTI